MLLYFAPYLYKIWKIRNTRVTLKSLWSFLTRFTELNEAKENGLQLKYLSVAVAETNFRDYDSDPKEF